jgi:hypothetical protein
MTLRDTVQLTPKDTKGAEGIVKVNLLFENFVHYGREVARWKYQASGRYEHAPTTYIRAEDILDGTNQGQVFCQPLAGAFYLLVKEVMGAARPTSAPASVATTFVTKAGYRSIDKNVVGNVRRPFNTYAMENRCLFSEHHFYKIGPTWYDPTLCQTYASEEECCEITLVRPPGEYPLLQDLRVSTDGQQVYLRTNEPVAGFACGYIHLAAPDSIKHLISPAALDQFNVYAKKVLGVKARK